MMMRQQKLQKRKGSVLVEYALLIAGVALASVVAIAVLGHKVSDQFGLMTVILPGAHLDDNNPIASGKMIGFKSDGTKIVLDSASLVGDGTAAGGADRTANLIGA